MPRESTGLLEIHGNGTVNNEAVALEEEWTSTARQYSATTMAFFQNPTQNQPQWFAANPQESNGETATKNLATSDALQDKSCWEIIVLIVQALFWMIVALLLPIAALVLVHHLWYNKWYHNNNHEDTNITDHDLTPRQVVACDKTARWVVVFSWVQIGLYAHMMVTLLIGQCWVTCLPKSRRLQHQPQQQQPHQQQQQHHQQQQHSTQQTIQEDFSASFSSPLPIATTSSNNSNKNNSNKNKTTTPPAASTTNPLMMAVLSLLALPTCAGGLFQFAWLVYGAVTLTHYRPIYPPGDDDDSNCATMALWAQVYCWLSLLSALCNYCGCWGKHSDKQRKPNGDDHRHNYDGDDDDDDDYSENQRRSSSYYGTADDWD